MAKSVPVRNDGLSGAGADPVMAPYWEHRPGVNREPTLPMERQVDELRPPLPMTDQARAQPPSSTPPQTDAAPNARELDVMHNLIEQLAAQLNAPAAGNPAGSAPSAYSIESVESSLTALRATAQSMRRPHVPGRLPVESVDDNHQQVDGVADRVDGNLAAPAAVASNYSRLAVITEAVSADRIDVLLDPIHGLADRKAKHFEIAIRLRSSDGDTLDASEYVSAAAGTGLLAKIDAAKLARTGRIAGRLQSRGTTASLFSNVAGESLTDDAFLDAFESVLAEQDNLPNRLVLTFAQADVRGFSDVHWDAIVTMSEIGIRFAVEAVTDLDMDFADLKAHGFEFVKLDAQVFLHGLPAADGPIPAPDLCRHLSNLGLGLVVGRIEDEMTMAKVLGFGVVFGQGALFGGPRPVKVDMSPAPNVVAA